METRRRGVRGAKGRGEMRNPGSVEPGRGGYRPGSPGIAVLALAASLLPVFTASCGMREKRLAYEKERDDLAATAARIQSVSLSLLVPKMDPDRLKPEDILVLVRSGSMEDLHENEETYIEILERENRSIEEETAKMKRILALRRELDRCRSLQWRGR